MNNKTIELHTIATFQGKEYELENLLNGLLNKLEEKDKEIERLKAREEEITQKYLSATKYASEKEDENNRSNNIINELEKDMREKYHKEIDYQSKIMQSDLMQGDYPVAYYYAEQNEKLLNYYLNKLKALKEGKENEKNIQKD